MHSVYHKMSDNFAIVHDQDGARKYSFGRVSSADSDSQLRKDFRAYLEGALDKSFGDKEMIFERPFRDQGVSHLEARLAAFKTLQSDRIVVLPYMSLDLIALGYPLTSIVHVSMNDQSDETEQFEVAADWLQKNAEKKTLQGFFGSLKPSTVKQKITKTYNVFSIQNDGSRILERSFDFKRLAEEFADEYAVSNNVDMVVSSTEEQVRSPKKGNLNRLRIEYSEFDSSRGSDGFIVVSEGIDAF